MISGFIIFLFIVCGGIVLFVKRAKSANKIDAVADSTDYFQMQLEESADQIIARMQNHVDHLEYLISEADEKIFALDQRLKKIDRLNHEVHVPSKSSDEQERLVSDDGESNTDNAMINMDVSTLNKQVYSLLDQGMNLNEIAKKTGIGKGAVLLISQMYRKK